MARRGQQAVPEQELLLLAHRHQQVHCCCAGLGWGVLVQSVLQGPQVQPRVLSACHLNTTQSLVNELGATQQSVYTGQCEVIRMPVMHVVLNSVS